MTARALAKTAAAEALYRTGASRLAGGWSARRGDPLVLGYHQVVEDCDRGSGAIPAMRISARMLERHLDGVGRRYRFVSLDELAERLEAGRPSGRALAAVTFDDGYRDFHEHAFPLLRRKGIPAALFVVTDLLGTTRLQRHDRVHLAAASLLAREGGAARLVAILDGLGLARPAVRAVAAAPRPDAFAILRALLETLTSEELEGAVAALDAEGAVREADHPELQPLTWEMVAEMAEAGVTIGSHTRSHPILTHESRERMREELRASREALEVRLGRPVRHFAYPDGGFDESVVDEVAAAGYGHAYTTCGHRSARHPGLTVPRRLLWENSARDHAGEFSPAILHCQLDGVFDAMSACRRRHDHGAAA